MEYYLTGTQALNRIVLNLSLMVGMWIDYTYASISEINNFIYVDQPTDPVSYTHLTLPTIYSV